MAEVVSLKAPLGARIEGLERGRANEPAIAALLNRALAEHLLVVTPGEPMTPEATLGFARAFGKPRTQLLRYKHSGATPEVSIMVSTLKTDGTTDKTAIRAEDWHTDDSYFAIPAKATLLHGIEIPSRGGATWFCNMHSVYEALPETLRRRIDGLRSIHGYDTPRARNRPSARTPQEIAETPDVEHPLVRTHPETGRKAIFLGDHAQEIEGMDYEEGRALIEEVNALITPQDRVYTHVWSPRECMVWDNRCTLHRATGFDEANHVRVMRRCTINGDRPY